MTARSGSKTLNGHPVYIEKSGVYRVIYGDRIYAEYQVVNVQQTEYGSKAPNRAVVGHYKYSNVSMSFICIVFLAARCCS